MNSVIDTNFDVESDTPKGKDRVTQSYIKKIS